jgi:hypothetical protein
MQSIVLSYLFKIHFNIIHSHDVLVFLTTFPLIPPIPIYIQFPPNLWYIYWPSHSHTENVDWIHLSQNRVKWRVISKKTLKLCIVQKEINFFSSWATASFSQETQVHTVSDIVHIFCWNHCANFSTFTLHEIISVTLREHDKAAFNYYIVLINVLIPSFMAGEISR